MQPIQGKTYQSAKDPSFRITLETVSFEEPDEDGGGYYVEACRAEEVGNPAADGMEFDNEEWLELVREHGLTPTT